VVIAGIGVSGATTNSFKLMSDIFSRKYQEFRYRCAYCGRDLFSDVDTFMGSTLDHIVPQCSGEPESDTNKALSCAVCNTLKGGFDPREGDLTRHKEQLISRAREYIFKRRSEKVVEFFKYLEGHEKV
jgi:hypothetical protein